MTYRSMLAAVIPIALLSGAIAEGQVTIHVDPDKGLTETLARLKEPLTQDVTIHLAPGTHDIMPGGTLLLDHRMKGTTRVRIRGPEGEKAAILDWEGSGRPYLIEVFEGRWSLENVQIGSRKKRQRQGISVRGPAVLEMMDVKMRTRSFSGAALRAHGGGEIHLKGRIEINEDLHDEIEEDESFAGIVAEDHGIVRFYDSKGSLSVGNGSLASSYYGVIRLGCETARITSWGGQSNCIAVNNSGRVDLHGTETTLCAKRTSNCPIGLEDDGHVLAEGAHIIIDAPEGGSGIVLQKSSALYCNDIEFRGEPKYTLVAYSGSSFVGGFLSDVRGVSATTGASVVVGKCEGKLAGPFQATKGGTLIVPE